MTQPRILNHHWASTLRPEPVSLPPIVTRLVGVALALAVTTVHIADQGGVTEFAAPNWLGWAYRLIELGGVLVAVTLVWPPLARLGWAAGVLLGAGPLAGYLASRTVGVPSDPGDVGNWSDWVGTLSLVLEAGLIVISLGMLWAYFHHSAMPAGADESAAQRPAHLPV
jgi:hypothetical protein